PITMSRAEVRRSAALLHAVAERGAESLVSRSASDAYYRYESLGVVAVVTPWNNPVAIPVGKVAPALLYGNTVVWKPSPAAGGVARTVMDLARAAGWDGPDSPVVLCTGDQATACALAADARVDAVTLS